MICQFLKQLICVRTNFDVTKLLVYVSSSFSALSGLLQPPLWLFVWPVGIASPCDGVLWLASILGLACLADCGSFPCSSVSALLLLRLSWTLGSWYTAPCRVWRTSWSKVSWSLLYLDIYVWTLLSDFLIIVSLLPDCFVVTLYTYIFMWIHVCVTWNISLDSQYSCDQCLSSFMAWLFVNST